MTSLVLATRSRGKVSEFRALLAPIHLDVSEMPPDIAVVEDGATYLENAVKKARTVADFTGSAALADDSGIEIDALDGAPGIHSARFLTGSTDEDKCARILELLRGRTIRSARFVIALVLADISRVLFVAQAFVTGQIAAQMRGTNGFGYDPIFIPTGLAQTMAELPTAEKNMLSHRSRAARALIRYLRYTRDDAAAGESFGMDGARARSA